MFLSLYCTCKILRAIVSLFFSIFFQSFIPAGKSISTKLYWSVNDVIFVILSGWFRIFWWFNATITEYGKHAEHLVFFGFFIAFLFANHSGDLTYELPFLDLFYEYDQTINQHIQIAKLLPTLKTCCSFW